MKTYYVTVENPAVAFKLDWDAEVAVVLPPDEVVGTYCCQEPQVIGHVPERYVFKVNTDLPRKAVKGAAGVHRVRAVLPVPFPHMYHPSVRVC